MRERSTGDTCARYAWRDHGEPFRNYGAPLGTKPKRVISTEITVFAPIAFLGVSARMGKRGEGSLGERKGTCREILEREWV